MTENSEGQNWSDEMDRPEHEQTYDNFITYTKWTCVAIVAALVFLLVFVYD